MKNIEKYPNTQDALKEYNDLVLKRVPFDIWLNYEHDEHEEPHSFTLLEAAKAVTTAWFSIGDKGSLAEVSKRICALSYAIEREKQKPIRNCDRPECATTKSAQEVWRKEDGGKTAYYEWLLATSTKGGAK